VVSSLHKFSRKTKNKMQGRRTEGCIADPSNTRMEVTSRRYRIVEVSFRGGQGPDGFVAP
jgi:hypothetical protein